MQSQSGSLRGLKALVAILGILVVLGTAVVAGVIVRRLLAPPGMWHAAPALANAGAGAAAAWRPPMADTTLLPKAAHITAIAASNGVVAVAVSTPQGDQLWIISLDTGAKYVALAAQH